VTTLTAHPEAAGIIRQASGVILSQKLAKLS
jgi:hypothetical protein